VTTVSNPKIKVPKGEVCSDAIKEPFLVPHRTLQRTVLERIIFFLVIREFFF